MATSLVCKASISSATLTINWGELMLGNRWFILVVVVIVGIVLLASGRNALVFIVWFVFVALVWVSIFGLTSCSGHGFSFSSL